MVSLKSAVHRPPSTTINPFEFRAWFLPKGLPIVVCEGVAIPFNSGLGFYPPSRRRAGVSRCRNPFEFRAWFLPSSVIRNLQPRRRNPFEFRAWFLLMSEIKFVPVIVAIPLNSGLGFYAPVARSRQIRQGRNPFEFRAWFLPSLSCDRVPARESQSL